MEMLIEIPARRGKAAFVSTGQIVTAINTHGEQAVWPDCGRKPASWARRAGRRPRRGQGEGQTQNLSESSFDQQPSRVVRHR
jgi:hypothetical protein